MAITDRTIPTQVSSSQEKRTHSQLNRQADSIRSSKNIADLISTYKRKYRTYEREDAGCDTINSKNMLSIFADKERFSLLNQTKLNLFKIYKLNKDKSNLIIESLTSRGRESSNSKIESTETLQNQIRIPLQEQLVNRQEFTSQVFFNKHKKIVITKDERDRIRRQRRIQNEQSDWLKAKQHFARKLKRILSSLKELIRKMLRYELTSEKALSINFNPSQPFNAPNSYIFLKYTKRGMMEESFMILRSRFKLIFEFDLEKNTAYHLATLQNNHIFLYYLLLYKGDLNGKNVYGRTALDIAIVNGYEDCVRLLLAAGANAFTRYCRIQGSQYNEDNASGMTKLLIRGKLLQIISRFHKIRKLKKMFKMALPFDKEFNLHEYRTRFDVDNERDKYFVGFF